MLHVQPQDFFDRPDDDTSPSGTPTVHISQKAKRTIFDVSLGLGIMLAALSGGAYLMVKNTTTDNRSKAGGEPQSFLAMNVSPISPGQPFTVDLVLNTVEDENYSISGVDAIVSYSFTPTSQSSQKGCTTDDDCGGGRCYQPPMPLCPEGQACIQVFPSSYCMPREDGPLPIPPGEGVPYLPGMDIKPIEMVINPVPPDNTVDAALSNTQDQLVLTDLKQGSLFDEYPTANRGTIISNQNTIALSGVKAYAVDDQGHFKGFSGKGVFGTLHFIAPKNPGKLRIQYVYRGATTTDDTNINGFSTLLAASVQKPQERLLSAPPTFEAEIGTAVPSPTPTPPPSKTCVKDLDCAKGEICYQPPQPLCPVTINGEGCTEKMQPAYCRPAVVDYPAPPEGCRYESVQCFKDPCEKMLICEGKTSTPSSTTTPPSSGCSSRNMTCPANMYCKIIDEAGMNADGSAPGMCVLGTQPFPSPPVQEKACLDVVQALAYVAPLRIHVNGIYVNWGGLQEKWFVDSTFLPDSSTNEGWYYIYPKDGKYMIMKWLKGLTVLSGNPNNDVLVATMDSPLCYNALTNTFTFPSVSVGPTPFPRPTIAPSPLPPTPTPSPILIATPVPSSTPKPATTLRIPVEVGLEGNPAVLPSLTLYIATAPQDLRMSVSSTETLQAVGTVPLQRNENSIPSGVFEIVDASVIKTMSRPVYLYVDTPAHLRTYYGKPIAYMLTTNTKLNFGTLAAGNVYADSTSSAKDNTINTFDVAEMFTQWGDPKTECVGSDTGACFRKYQSADLNGDGIVNNRDYALLMNNFGKQGAQFPPGVVKTPPTDWDLDGGFIPPEPPISGGGGGEELTPVNRAPVQ
ncbi:MAG: hypothetical protein HZA34_02675 [Candidatus Pacebacteria bacterium]|nr:hypothetical protein [Candidatus Paceibacterota bacterium]